MDSGSDENKSKGFAGLDSMVSDVSAEVEKAAQATSPKAHRSEQPPSESSQSPAQSAPRLSPSKSSAPTVSGKSSLGWIIAGVVVLVIWVANSGTPSPSYSPPPSYSAPAPAAAPAPAYAPVPAQVPAPVQVSDEQMPPVGRDNVLSIPQIRWCKREKIRIEAIERVINNAYEHEVNRFNAKVNNYNSRCGEFRYRRGNVEQVDRELTSERASIESKAKSEWVRNSLGLKDGTVATTTKERTPSPNKQTSLPMQDSAPLADSLSYEERGSIESACSTEKTLHGPAAYNKCVSKKISALRSGPRNIDLSGLNYEEKESIESACSTQKTLYGPAEYNKCLSGKLSALKAGPRNVDLSGLSYSDRESIQSACSTQKTLYGPAEYNKCITQKLRQLRR